MSEERAEYAVTTRSRLKGLRYFPFMFIASLQVRRQLARTPGVLRWASVIAGPTEFWTVTVWSSRDRMIEFMGSGAHESIMWLFGKWLRSFWLTRWRPTQQEQGDWDGLVMAPPPRPRTPFGTKTPAQQAALDGALSAFPRLRDSVDSDGAATLGTAGFTRRRERSVAGVGAIMVRVAVERPGDITRLWRSMRALRRSLEEREDVLRSAVGWATPREAFALVVIRDAIDGQGAADTAEQHLDRVVAGLRTRWDGGVWSMRWDAANEFGHWDGLRIRQNRTRDHGLDLPPGAEAAASLE